MREYTKAEIDKIILKDILNDLEKTQLRIEDAINRTPTSERRDILTDTNIHLMMAKESLIESMKKES